MRHIYFLLLLCSMLSMVACNDTQVKPDQNVLLTGNWLVLYPDHQIKTKRESEIYGRHQDSIVKLYGLKLISFDKNGQFREMDSLNTIGKWTLSNDSTVEIRDGGKGFKRFFSKWEDFENDTLQLSEFVPLENKIIKLVWHLKKIPETDSKSFLFKDSANSWRKKPSKPETDEEIRQRLSSMLNFYADYFFLVGKESSYFIPARVALPFKYYQHALRMAPETPPQFMECFYNQEQSEKARSFLDQTIKKLEEDFPREEDFVREYASFMEIMARAVIMKKT